MLSIKKMSKRLNNASLWIALRVPGTPFLTFSAVATIQALRTGFKNVRKKKKRKKLFRAKSRGQEIIALFALQLRQDHKITSMTFPSFLLSSLPPSVLPPLSLLSSPPPPPFWFKHFPVKKISKMFPAWKIYKICKYTSEAIDLNISMLRSKF